MRIGLILLVLIFSVIRSQGQNVILFDLDSYKRVEVDRRTRTIDPRLQANLSDRLNRLNEPFYYDFMADVNLYDSHFVNSDKTQKAVEQSFGFLVGSSSSNIDKELELNYSRNLTKRTYEGNRFFKTGVLMYSGQRYTEGGVLGLSLTSSQRIMVDLGIGFGRVEFVNDAWLGARILEELNKEKLLLKMPSFDEMTSFFDLVGKLKMDRVLDIRLKQIYELEGTLSFLSDYGFLDPTSIASVTNLYDTYRYEGFINRFSGQRLEFTLSPFVQGNYWWTNSTILAFPDDHLIPGIEGTTEYVAYTNGDLRYYTEKVFGGKLSYARDIYFNEQDDVSLYEGRLYFTYNYSYIPSLRTRLSLYSQASAGFTQGKKFDSFASLSSQLTYYYYFSPRTQFRLLGSFTYNDQEFQVGDFQPIIRLSFEARVHYNIL